MKGYFIDSDTMQELWERLAEIDLDNVNAVRDALGFAKGILYPIKLADYAEIKPKESEETETWNGIHAQITAPKGTFERIWNEAERGEE